MKPMTSVMIVLALGVGMAGNASAAMVAHYKFDGNANDSSGNNLHGTAYGGPTYVPGVFGQAIRFDGIDDYVNCGNSPLFNITSQITLTAWVKTNDCGNGDFNPFLTKGDASYALKHIASNEIEFAAYTTTYYTATFPVNNSFKGVWHHLAATYDGIRVKLYLDGELKANSVGSGIIATSAFNVNIGRCSEVTSWFYNGLIDDLRIYNHALSPAEIEALMTVSVDTNKAFTYQGRLMDDNAPAEGIYDLRFVLFGSPNWEDQLDFRTIEDVEVVDGYFTVLLDFGVEVFDGNPRWLEIGVRPGTGEGDFVVLNPRRPITPTPYALYAKTADTVTGPFSVPLEVYGSVPFTLDPPSAVFEATNMGTGYGIYGNAVATAIFGQSNTDHAIVGKANAYQRAGVFGQNDASQGYGLQGIATGTNGTGVQGESNSGYGVAGRTNAETGSGVHGSSTIGKGISGETTSSNEWVSAIYGQNKGSGDGVYGKSQARYGVYGITQSQNPNHAGVYGTNHGNGPAIVADGDLEVKGDLRVSGGMRGVNLGPNNGSPFPRPAYDSGWIVVPVGDNLTLTHNIGGDVEHYVVDMQMKQETGPFFHGIHNAGIGVDNYVDMYQRGALWKNLTSNTIELYRPAENTYLTQHIRIRIWVYN
ncbi:MAG: LamG domain-containing protein [Phycisphaerae bacterium]|nr:LamG domain-containing protein [Phycisphaerae bacterium]